MRSATKRAIQMTFAVTLLGFAAATFIAPKAVSQESGWITLFDGKSMNGWSPVGESNWHIEDGVLIADKLGSKELAYLVNSNSYKNFIVRVEFWSSDDANSGIYFRCLDPKKPTDRTCYEANIFDQRPDPSYGTGAITRYVEVNPMPKAGGKWNTIEITAKGRDITVVLNGQTTATLRNGMFDEGPIALQHGAGAIKFRKVEVKPL
jgi:3-keto-disaccharide hydrolase